MRKMEKNMRKGWVPWGKLGKMEKFDLRGNRWLLKMGEGKKGPCLGNEEGKEGESKIRGPKPGGEKGPGKGGIGGGSGTGSSLDFLKWKNGGSPSEGT